MVGMLAGSDGIGGIHFDSPGIAQFIGVIAFELHPVFRGFENRLDIRQTCIWTVDCSFCTWSIDHSNHGGLIRLVDNGFHNF